MTVPMHGIHRSFLLACSTGRQRGRMRKGLFHVIEIVIITIVTFVLITQISGMVPSGHGWEKSLLEVQGRDILVSMDESGIDWADADSVRENIGYGFNITRINYRVELLGAPKEKISVGCLCDGGAGCSEFCTWLESMLEGRGTMTINNMKFNFSVAETDVINNVFDVTVTNQPLTGQETYLPGYLSSGKGFVLARNLDAGDFSSYRSMLRNYFATDTGSSGSLAVSFELSGMPQNHEYYMMPKYFSHIPNGTGDFYNMTHTFSPFSSDSVQKVSGPEGFVMLETGSGHPACIAKYPAWGGRGRSAWISQSPRQDDMDILLTSLILWASEQRRVLTDSDMGQEAARVSIYTMPKDTSRADYMFMPMEVVLSLGYLYS
jgi:hypothetical protein